MNAETKKRTPLYWIVITIGILIACLIVWKAIDVFLIAFSAILLAIILNTISRFFSRRWNIPYTLTLIVVVVVLVGLLTLAFWISAPLINEQLKTLLDLVPRMYEQLTEKISEFIDFSHLSKEKLASEILFGNQIFSQATALFSITFGTITSLFILLLVGIYLAATPYKYENGFLFLFPSSKKNGAKRVIENIEQSLRWWLLGKLISMSIVGVTTFLGLKLLHVPLALILALLAALLTFIPYIGPILASIPAILIGLTVSYYKAFYVALLYLGIHTIEGYFITPYIEQRTVFLPPALTIMMQVLMGVTIGFLGLLFASPLLIVVLALIKEIYLKSATYSPNKLNSK